MSIQPLIKNDRLAHTALFPNKEAFSIQTKDINLRSNDGAIDLIMDYDTNLGYHHLALSCYAMHACQPTPTSITKKIRAAINKLSIIHQSSMLS